MTPRLIVIAGLLRGTTFPMEGESLLIGREPSSGVLLAEPSVSRHHCLIRREEERFIITDLDSFNGTFVNGLPVKEQALAHGDQFAVGDTLVLFLTREEEPLDGSGLAPVGEEDLTARSTIQLERKDALYLDPERLLATLPAANTVARHLNTLLKISGMVGSLRDSAELQRVLLEILASDIPAQRAAILLGDEAGGEFISALGWDGAPGSVKTVQVSRTVARRVLREGVSLLSNDVAGAGEFPDAESLVASNVYSLMCVPLAVAGKTFGVIYLDTAEPGATFNEEDLQLLTAIGGIASVALENVRTFEHLLEENQRLRDDFVAKTSFIGESVPMRRVGELIAKIAPQESTLLIRGESGTGKELAARAVHDRSLRQDKPFVAINCATLTENLLESELFGHERGAFTGAVTMKKGKLEVAQGGTIFLDEVGELPPTVQAKLLRVLQEREYERLGATRPMKTDVRVIAATNKDLEAAVRQGSFREDLYYRLNVISLKMPSLSERREDIPLLANYFLSKYSRKCKRRVVGISPEAHACLKEYWWPGNVRELENAIEYAVVLGATDFIALEDLPETIVAGRQSTQNSALKFYQAVIEFKKQLVLNALKEAEGNVTEAARLLGIYPPNNLHRIINNLGLRDLL